MISAIRNNIGYRENLNHILYSAASELPKHVEKVQSTLERFNTSAQVVIDRQIVDIWLFGIGIPVIFALLALVLPWACP